MKQYNRDEVIVLLKSDIKALEGFVNSIPHGRFKEDRFEYTLIDHLMLTLNLLKSDKKHNRDEVIALLKSDIKALEGIVKHRRFNENRFAYVLIDNLISALNLLESEGSYK